MPSKFRDPGESDARTALAPAISADPERDREMSKLRGEAAASAEALSDVRRDVGLLLRRVSELEEQTARSQAHFDASVAFFEQRIDHIYGRILSFLAERGGVPPGPDDPFAQVPMSDVLSLASADRMRWQIDNSQSFLMAGHFRPPLTAFGFLMTLGAAREDGESVEVSGGDPGVVIYGPYKRLRVGRYRIVWTVAPERAPQDALVELAFDVYCPSTETVLGAVRHSGELDARMTLEIAFEVPTALLQALFELRAFRFGRGGFRILGVDVIREPG